MSPTVLSRVVTTPTSVTTQTAATQGVRGAPRKGSETADYSLKGCLKCADPRGKWASFAVSTNAHWFLELRGFSSAQITHF
jgi:hypothetical protein